MARIILFLNIFFICKSQVVQANFFADTTQIQLKLQQTIQGKFESFYIDNFGNVFLVTPSQQIKKFNARLDSVGLFNDVKRFGNIFSADVSNPLKVLIYYKDFATIVVLDRQLNSRNNIQLRAQNYFQVGAVAQSYDNNIWIFNEVTYQLKKIDESGKTLFTSNDFRLVFNNPFLPELIIDNNGYVYLYNKQQGFTVFDYYGALKAQYPIYNWQHVQVVNNWLYGVNANYMYRYQIAQQQFYVLQPNIPLNDVKKLVWQQNNCYMLTSKGLFLYKVL